MHWKRTTEQHFFPSQCFGCSWKKMKWVMVETLGLIGFLVGQQQQENEKTTKSAYSYMSPLFMGNVKFRSFAFPIVYRVGEALTSEWNLSYPQENSHKTSRRRLTSLSIFIGLSPPSLAIIECESLIFGGRFHVGHNRPLIKYVKKIFVSFT